MRIAAGRLPRSEINNLQSANQVEQRLDLASRIPNDLGRSGSQRSVNRR
jgi:hypothetical protein